jgi:hypothetical protein
VGRHYRFQHDGGLIEQNSEAFKMLYTGPFNSHVHSES